MAVRPRNTIIVGRLALVLVVLAAPVVAHVPGFAGENTAHETAMHLEDGATSRAIYADLDTDEVRYFEVHLEPGQRLQASVFTPTRSSFTPGIVVYGPAVESAGTLPAQVQIPSGMGARVVTGKRATRPEFEPFTPAAYFQTASVSLPARADHYWIAVYEPDGAPGRVGTAIGYVETFAPAEFLLVPVELIGVHRWEGDGPLVLIGPYLLAGVLAIWLGRRRHQNRPTGRQFALTFAGVLFLGGGLLTGIQLLVAAVAAGVGPGAILSLLFVLVPATIGVWCLDIGTRPLSLSRRRRGALLGGAVLGLVTWGGILVGPVLLGILAVLPTNRP